MTHIGRRKVLVLVLAAAAALSAGTVRAASVTFPAEADLQSGDLLWPKQPGVFIPYGTDTSADSDQRAWEADKLRAMAELEANLNVNTAPLLSALSSLGYAEFRQRYFNGIDVGEFVPYATGGVAAVGHVGIVHIGADGKVMVVDANPGPGVAATPYALWISERSDHVFWWGRLKNRTATERQAVAEAASAYVGKPYDFWNLDLADGSGFYCSKLVWLAGFEALGIALDGDEQPDRSFWLSPKQLLASADVEILLDQGDYMWD